MADLNILEQILAQDPYYMTAMEAKKIEPEYSGKWYQQLLQGALHGAVTGGLEGYGLRRAREESADLSNALLNYLEAEPDSRKEIMVNYPKLAPFVTDVLKEEAMLRARDKITNSPTSVALQDYIRKNLGVDTGEEIPYRDANLIADIYKTKQYTGFQNSNLGFKERNEVRDVVNQMNTDTAELRFVPEHIYLASTKPTAELKKEAYQTYIEFNDMLSSMERVKKAAGQKGENIYKIFGDEPEFLSRMSTLAKAPSRAWQNLGARLEQLEKTMLGATTIETFLTDPITYISNLARATNPQKVLGMVEDALREDLKERLVTRGIVKETAPEIKRYFQKNPQAWVAQRQVVDLLDEAYDPLTKQQLLVNKPWLSPDYFKIQEFSQNRMETPALENETLKTSKTQGLTKAQIKAKLEEFKAKNDKQGALEFLQQIKGQ